MWFSGNIKTNLTEFIPNQWMAKCSKSNNRIVLETFNHGDCTSAEHKFIISANNNTERSVILNDLTNQSGNVPVWNNNNNNNNDTENLGENTYEHFFWLHVTSIQPCILKVFLSFHTCAKYQRTTPSPDLTKPWRLSGQITCNTLLAGLESFLKYAGWYADQEVYPYPTIVSNRVMWLRSLSSSCRLLWSTVQLTATLSPKV